MKTAIAAIPGLTALSPTYGFPRNGMVGDLGFRFYPDQAMVSEAHARGLKVIRWTCDDHPVDLYDPATVVVTREPDLRQVTPRVEPLP